MSFQSYLFIIFPKVEPDPLMERFHVLSKLFVYYLSKSRTGSLFGYIPLHYMLIVGGYMVDGYEMGNYEWPSMSLRYSIICTLIAIR